jgi:hypothetical protein
MKTVAEANQGFRGNASLYFAARVAVKPNVVPSPSGTSFEFRIPERLSSQFALGHLPSTLSKCLSPEVSESLKSLCRDAMTLYGYRSEEF